MNEVAAKFSKHSISDQCLLEIYNIHDWYLSFPEINDVTIKPISYIDYENQKLGKYTLLMTTASLSIKESMTIKILKEISDDTI